MMGKSDQPGRCAHRVHEASRGHGIGAGSGSISPAKPAASRSDADRDVRPGRAGAMWLRLRAGQVMLLLALLCGCQLPANTALRDWAGLASVAVDQATMTAPDVDARLAMSEALSIHFFALGILADGGSLTFREDAYASIARRLTADPDSALAVERIGLLLAMARDDAPPRWLVDDVRSPRPAYEDRRLANLLRGSDGPVQALLGALARSQSAEARQVLLQLGEGHALMTRAARHLAQQETLRQMRAMEARLRRAVVALPPSREANRDLLAGVLLP